jgi:acyl-CoA synthetase (AMP-forming)/AMP-acid ligase II
MCRSSPSAWQACCAQALPASTSTALHRARLEHQLKDSGATAIIILENFAHTLAQVLERSHIRHICLTSMGDLLGGLYGSWITFCRAPPGQGAGL